MINLSDNALFLKNIRERMRPSTIISYFIVAVLILGVLFSSVLMTISQYKSPQLQLFWYLLCFQTILLLALGSWNAHQASLQESNNGTLDFHRASPPPPLGPTLGILFCSTSFELCFFFLTLPLGLLLALQSPLGIWEALSIYTSIILCAVFFHVISIFIGLNQFGLNDNAGKHIANIQTASLATVLLLLFMLPTIDYIAYTSKIHPVLSFTTCQPILTNTFNLILANSTWTQVNTTIPKTFILYSNTSPLVLQIVVQCPFVVLLDLGVVRVIRQPHLPPISKTQHLCLSGYSLFLSTIHLYTQSFHTTNRTYESFNFYGIFILIVFFSIIGTFLATPKRLSYLIKIRQDRRSTHNTFSLLDDHASNMAWLLCFIAITLTGISTLKPLMKFNDYSLFAAVTIILILQIITFACSWEAFHLSTWGKKAILFFVGISIPWLFLPIFAGILHPFYTTNTTYDYGYAFSPFLLSTLWSSIDAKNVFSGVYLNVLLINITSATIAFAAAYWQRLEIKRNH